MQKLVAPLRCRMLRVVVGRVFVFVAMMALSSCGEKPKPKRSPWVGSYTIENRHYENGKPYAGNDLAYYRIGDVPRLFICLNAQVGTGCVVYDNVVENANAKLTFYSPSATHSEQNGLPIPGRYDHFDLTVSLYANTQTAEVVTIQYTTNSLDSSRAPAPSSIVFTSRDTGSYIKTNSNNSDCRKYSPPCD